MHFFSQIDMAAFQAGFFQQLAGKPVGIGLIVPDSRNAAIDQHFGAEHTRMVGAVYIRALKHQAVNRGLDNDILLRMEATANFMPLPRWHAHFFTQAASFPAMRHALRRAVIARCQNAPVLYGHGPDLAPHARRALGHKPCNVHEILRPGKSHARGLCQAKSGKCVAKSRTLSRMAASAAGSSRRSRLSTIKAATVFMSSSSSPLVVRAAVPRRTPLVTNGDLVSCGTEFLLTVMPAASRAVSASLPVKSLLVRSISRRWLSVPPETRSKPAACNSSARTLAFLTTCLP